MKKREKFSNFPIIEVFGTTFALLVVLFIVLNIFTERDLQSRLEKTVEEGEYKISWENNSSGYIVITFEDNLFITENSKQVPVNDICKKDSAFIKYAKNIYSDKKKQIVFAIVENGTRTMKEARDCIREIFPKKAVSIAWIIANEELLKSVSIEQIPEYIKEAIK
jgi:hemerythrin-like domain-containing protein